MASANLQRAPDKASADVEGPLPGQSPLGPSPSRAQESPRDLFQAQSLPRDLSQSSAPCQDPLPMGFSPTQYSLLQKSMIRATTELRY